MTASYSGTHGPSRGDCKLCNSAVKQRGIMAKRKGQTVDGSLGPKCECADLGCAAREEGLQQLRKPGGPVTGLLVRVGFTFFKNLNVLSKPCLPILGEFQKLGGTFTKDSSHAVLPKVTECPLRYLTFVSMAPSHFRFLLCAENQWCHSRPFVPSAFPAMP